MWFENGLPSAEPVKAKLQSWTSWKHCKQLDSYQLCAQCGSNRLLEMEGFVMNCFRSEEEQYFRTIRCQIPYCPYGNRHVLLKLGKKLSQELGLAHVEFINNSLCAQHEKDVACIRQHRHVSYAELKKKAPYGAALLPEKELLATFCQRVIAKGPIWRKRNNVEEKFRAGLPALPSVRTRDHDLTPSPARKPRKKKRLNKTSSRKKLPCEYLCACVCVWVQV